MMMKELPQGPTLNPSYNELILVYWPKQTGKTYEPECEHCDADMTGENVHDTGIGWVCDHCYETSDFGGQTDWREDFHADG